MRIRETSLEAYFEMRDSGALSELESQVYWEIAHNPGKTRTEVWMEHFRARQKPSITSRICDLRDLGVIREEPKRPCRYTGRNSYTLHATTKAISLDEKKEFKRIQELKQDESRHSLEEENRLLRLRIDHLEAELRNYRKSLDRKIEAVNNSFSELQGRLL